MGKVGSGVVAVGTDVAAPSVGFGVSTTCELGTGIGGFGTLFGGSGGVTPVVGPAGMSGSISAGGPLGGSQMHKSVESFSELQESQPSQVSRAVVATSQVGATPASTNGVTFWRQLLQLSRFLL